MSSESTCVVATAGHVDHGKSTLVHALTGTDPDRLAEEKRRGLTIDLGFAEMRTSSGPSVAFVDVPGHVRFISNMLAGVGAVDAALFVVDVIEGWKPQSAEHLRILDLVGVTRGIVVLSKVTKAEPDLIGLARDEIRTQLTQSCLQDAPILAVDALAGVGMDELRHALDTLASEAAERSTSGRARLWIDRAFVIGGAGCVVTGTLTGSALRVGDEVSIVGAHAVRMARIRRLQSFGRDREEVGPGSRAAVNLAGIAHQEVARGDTLVHPDRWHLTRSFDASVTVLEGATAGVGRRGALMLFVGTRESTVRVRTYGGASIAPGHRGLARLTVPVDLPLSPGDRFVLRDVGRGETVGGGQVLDVDPTLPVSKATPDLSVDRVVRDHGWIRPDELERRTGERRAANLSGWVVDPGLLHTQRTALLQRIDAAGVLGLDVSLLDERERAVLRTLTDVVVNDGVARTADAAAAADTLDQHPFVGALEASPFQPPTPEEFGVDPAELRQLVRRGVVVQEDGISFAASALQQAAELVASMLRDKPEGVTAGDVRQALGTTRKWARPILAVLDARGVTRRRGDVRVAGPRCPTT